MLMVEGLKVPSMDPRREWLDPPGGGLDLRGLLAIFRRQFWLFLVLTILGGIAGAVYITLAAPLYTATSSILINTQALRAVEGASGPSVVGADKNDNYIDNQAEVIKSDSIALSVVRRLDLTNNPLFLQRGFLGSVIGYVTSAIDQWFDLTAPEPLSDDALRMLVVARLQAGLEVRRVTNTSVIDVYYTTSDPVLAARISNTFAAAYLEDQFETRQEMSTRSRSWLEDRIKELSEKSLAADLTIQRFRAENNLITADGKLITDQQMSELNTQLTVARAETSRTEARYVRIQAVLDAGRTDTMLGATLEDPVVNNLRSKYLDVSKRESDIAARLGSDHAQAVTLRDEMRQYERLISGELRRIADSYRNDFEVTKVREQSLKESLASLAEISAAESDLTPKLRELERKAETLRTLHKELLQRYQESGQLESFPIAEARIISDAWTPFAPSYPRQSLVLAISLFGGALVGAGIAFLRDFGDQSLRTGGQVREMLGVEFLGNLPKIVPCTDISSPPKHEELAKKHECYSPPMMRYVTQAPLSSYAETLRSVKVAVDYGLQGEPSKVIGITSALTDEGKSTTAKNFANLLAMQGARTLLIDADLRNPDLTRTIAPAAESGLVEALIEHVAPESLILREVDTALCFLPAAGGQSFVDTSNLLTSPPMRELLQWAREQFDYIILDLPPIGPVVDVKACAPLLSALLVVVEWGHTPSQLVRDVVLTDKVIRDTCLGVVLNKVDTNALPKYEPLSSLERQKQKSYRRYFHEI
jgi:polysaccharide biosynthesis transport protein